MTGSVGYDADRLDELDRQTRWALTALDAIRSHDAAADVGLDARSALRRVLADHWMPAIGAILRHDPLGRPAPRCEVPAVRTPTTGRFVGYDDERIIDALRDLERLWPLGDGGHAVDPTSSDDEAEALVAEVIRRLDDADFVRFLLAEAGELDVVAWLAATGRVEPSIAAEVAVIRLSTYGNGSDADEAARASTITDRLLDAVSRSAEASRRVLDDPWVRARLATDADLDGHLVARLVAIAMAGDDRPLSTLLDFVDLADAGYRFPPGLCLGLAIGFAAAAADVAGGLDRGNALADPFGGIVRHRGEAVGYDDLVSLFASVVDDETAQVTLAGIILELADAVPATAGPVATRLGGSPSDIATSIGVAFSPVVALTRLVFVDATTLQQGRLDELFAQHRARHANGVGVIRTVAGFVPGADAVGWFLGPIFAVVTTHTGDTEREEVADIGASVELDGMILDLTLRHLAGDDDTWSALFGGLSPEGSRALRGFASEAHDDVVSAEDLIGRLRRELPPDDHALVANLLATIVTAADADRL